jgi:hypothetical protein
MDRVTFWTFWISLLLAIFSVEISATLAFVQMRASIDRASMVRLLRELPVADSLAAMLSAGYRLSDLVFGQRLLSLKALRTSLLLSITMGGLFFGIACLGTPALLWETITIFTNFVDYKKDLELAVILLLCVGAILILPFAPIARRTSLLLLFTPVIILAIYITYQHIDAKFRLAWDVLTSALVLSSVVGEYAFVVKSRYLLRNIGGQTEADRVLWWVKSRWWWVLLVVMWDLLSTMALFIVLLPLYIAIVVVTLNLLFGGYILPDDRYLFLTFPVGSAPNPTDWSWPPVSVIRHLGVRGHLLGLNEAGVMRHLL